MKKEIVLPLILAVLQLALAVAEYLRHSPGWIWISSVIMAALWVVVAMVLRKRRKPE